MRLTPTQRTLETCMSRIGNTRVQLAHLQDQKEEPRHRATYGEAGLAIQLRADLQGSSG